MRDVMHHAVGLELSSAFSTASLANDGPVATCTHKSVDIDRALSGQTTFA